MSDLRELTFDTNAVSIDSVKKAAYRLIDHFSTEFVLDGSKLTTFLRFGAGKSEEVIEAIMDEFRKEVLDQDLRASIKAETSGVRNLILAHAFSRTGLAN